MTLAKQQLTTLTTIIPYLKLSKVNCSFLVFKRVRIVTKAKLKILRCENQYQVHNNNTQIMYYQKLQQTATEILIM